MTNLFLILINHFIANLKFPVYLCNYTIITQTLNKDIVYNFNGESLS
jgi:hypothetical protein